MKDERIKKLRKELNYLIEEEINKEIEENSRVLEDTNVDIKTLANEIYLKRGINISKIRRNFFDYFSEMVDLFKSKSNEIKKKMIIDIVYILVIIILMKIPIDLVRDIGCEFIEILSSEPLYYSLWNMIFLLIYIIVAICTFIIFVRSFNNKYNNLK